jgi:HEAT repeat protein
MRWPRVRFRTRSAMIAVAICALLLWFAPIGYRYWWTWTVIRDVKSGQAMRYSALGYARAGPRATRALRDAIRSDTVKTREAAVRVLGTIGRDAKAAVPDLAEAARRDPDRDVRMFAAASLGQIGSDAGEGVEPLIEVVRHEPVLQVVLVAIEALGRIGPAAGPAIPVLASIAKNPDHSARVFAALAMWRMGSEAQNEASVIVPTLINQLATGTSPQSREWAAEVLAEMAPIAGAAAPALRSATEDPDAGVCRAARNALAAIEAKPAHANSGDVVSPQ